MIEAIVALKDDQVPTILSYDSEQKRYTIGQDARQFGLQGKTNAFNFKVDLGAADKSFSQDKKYWIVPRFQYDEVKKTHITVDAQMLTAKEVTIFFLKEFLKDLDMPKEIIIGEPAERDTVWKENFRKHMREVFEQLYHIKPQFFPEPFAVFQYYRHYEGIFRAESKSEAVLVIDIGGGTFNSCVISTTEEGYLSRGGAKSVPLGFEAEFCGGSEIDKKLLETVIQKAKEQGIKWKDDPIARAEKSQIPVLLTVEDAKIRLSERIGASAKLAEDFSHLKETVYLEKGVLHPDMDIKVELTGEDLKTVIRYMWRRHWGNIITKTVTEAQKKISFDYLDKILVAGGSSRLPFTKEEIHVPIRSLVDFADIHFGSDTGKAVAFGIACECMEQVKRNPQLSVGKIAPCILNDLYLGFRRSRRDPVVVPKKIHTPDGSISREGQLLSAPFETEELTLRYKLDLPFDLEGRLFYCFSDMPFDGGPDGTYLNMGQDVLSVSNKGTKYRRKCELEIDFKTNGSVKPTFHFTKEGKTGGHEAVPCGEFYMENLRIQEGESFLGIDFGSSNSYLAKLLKPKEELESFEFPEFKIKPEVMDSLRELEKEIEGLRTRNLLNRQSMAEYAKDHILLLVFHSNKIEGSPLTKGETETALSEQVSVAVTKRELEAKNLRDAYRWMIDNVDHVYTDPEAFIRQINRMILNGISEGGGEYRKRNVSLTGMNFTPPPSISVPSHMERIGKELMIGPTGRSLLEFAVTSHTKLVAVHPFIDANGRTARLLMNAILLAGTLPVVVINFDDKQRYLDALSESNRGDISSLVVFVSECFRAQIEEIAIQPRSTEEPIVTKSIVECGDPIADAFKEIGVELVNDPLQLIMDEKLKELAETKEAEYDSWKQAFSTLLSEMRSICDEFNSNVRYRSAGFHIDLFEYDMLSFEKYLDILKNKKVSRTWFFGTAIVCYSSNIKVLFFFEHLPTVFGDVPNINKVVLTLVRFNGATYERLTSEPLTLRGVAYCDGQLVFLGRDGNAIKDTPKYALSTLLAELIKAYITVK